MLTSMTARGGGGGGGEAFDAGRHCAQFIRVRLNERDLSNFVKSLLLFPWNEK